MTARILCPDDHPERWSNPAEAFASVARALRDEVLPNPNVRRVIVLVGPPGSGKSTLAKQLAEQEPAAVIVDACHANKLRRAALVKQIRAARKEAIAVVLHTPRDVCIFRDAQREPPRRVGRQVIESQCRDLRHLPPSRVEGWSVVVPVEYEPERQWRLILARGVA